MSYEVLRLTVVILAALVVGSALMTAGRYLRAAIRLGHCPGRILARHVVEVALGTAGLAGGYAWAVYEGLALNLVGPPAVRLWLYVASMVLLLVGVLEIGRHQRNRTRDQPHRQEQVYGAIRDAIDQQRVTGPRGADRAAVLAANEVLALESVPPLEVPEPPQQRTAPSPADTGSTNPDAVSATFYGRHALRKTRS